MKYTLDNPTLINDSLIKTIDEDATRLKDVDSDKFKFLSLIPPVPLRKMREIDYPEEYRLANYSDSIEQKNMTAMKDGNIYLGEWLGEHFEGFGVLIEIEKKRVY